MKKTNAGTKINNSYIKNLHPEYITDAHGNKKSVILSIEDFEELLEDIKDLEIVAERINEPTVSHEKIITELKRNDIL